MKNINYPEVTIDFIRRFNNYWKNIPIIDRWLLGELLPPLFFAIGAFTVVSLSV